MSTYFAAVPKGSTHILVGGATSSTTAPLSPATATQRPTLKPAPPQALDPQRDVTLWLRTPDAKQYGGRWVMLDDNLVVVDHDSSPTALLDRHQDDRTPLVVFVDPSNVQLAV